MQTQSLTVLSVGMIVSLVGIAQSDYMGQAPPGLIPQIFAPGVISQSNRYENNIAFSPDGRECYFTVRTASWSSSWIMGTACEDGAWTTPRTASFSNNRSLCPSFSPDGKQLFFSANRNTAGSQAIFQCTRTGEGTWSAPVEMVRHVSSTANEWSCHLSDLGNMFVCSWRSGGQGGCDGWRIPSLEGKFQAAENLSIMNTGSGDCGVTPGPDESYVIFQSNRPGGHGNADMYISFARSEGGWTAPRNLGPKINSPQADVGPWISYDGRYLFFSSSRAGVSNIYWVETRAFLPDPNGPVQNATTGQGFSSIQLAIDFAQSGDTIVMEPGVYRESITLRSDISLQSVDPNDPGAIGGTIIQGDTENPVLTLDGTTEACRVEGLTLRAGSVGVLGIATHTTMRHCRIMDNATHGVELSEQSNPYLEHCLIAANGQTGITMHAFKLRRDMVECKPVLKNCIIVDNGTGSIVGGQPVIEDSLID